MKRRSWSLAACALVLSGVAALKGIQAQPAPVARPAFYVVEFAVSDPEGIKPYREQVESSFKPFGGHFMVRGGPIVSLEGDPPKGRFVIIGFDSVEKAQAWYNSPAYEKLKPIRFRTATSRAMILEGTGE